MPHRGVTRGRLVAAFLALYLIWGSTYLFIKWMVAGIPPFLAGALRNGAAGLLLYAWARSRGAARPTRAQVAVALLVGTMLLGIGNGLVNFAVQYVPSGLASLLVSSVPVFIVLVDWLRPRGTVPHGKVVAGLIVGVAGIAALVWSAGGIGASRTSEAATVGACLLLLFGSLSWAVGSIVSRHLPRHPDGHVATAMEMALAGAVLVGVSWVSGDIARFDPAHVPASSWGALAYLVLFGSIVAFSAYTWLLRVSTPARVATYAYVNPLVAVALGWAFGGERLSMATLGAAVLILAAVVLITLPERSATR
jgi:drug/metabolite transporter (DMT)-like permease